MTETLLYPDSIVDFLVEELSCEGTTGVSFTKLWELLSGRVTIDDFYKKTIYLWIQPDDRLEFYELVEQPAEKPTGGKAASSKGARGKVADGKVTDDEVVDDEAVEKETVVTVKVPALVDKYKYSSFDAKELEEVFVRVTEETLWQILTGFPKLNNPIGGHPFELLTEIARSREYGIDSLSLTRATNQDQRSLTARIKVLGSLIKKIRILKNGRTLSLFILERFYDPSKVENISLNSKSKELTVNLKDLREKIVNTLKSAKSGVRQVNDLRRELEMDKQDKEKKVFKSCVSYLEMRGYIAKVLVVSPVSPTNKFRSLKFLKDYVHSAEQADEDDDDDDEDDDDDDNVNDDLIDDSLKNLDDEEPSASLKSVVNLQVLDLGKNAIHVPSFNRFHPLQNQIYDIVDSHGTTGCSTNYLIEEVFGASYTRLFTKLIESYTSDKLLPHLANYGLIRHYDFQGRVKFYRYVSRKNLLVLSHQPEDPKGSTLPPYKPAITTVSELNRSQFVPLTSRVDIYEEDGQIKLYWFGETNDLRPDIRESLKRIKPTFPSEMLENIEPKRKRGRPKKGEERKKEVKKVKSKGEEKVHASTTVDAIAADSPTIQGSHVAAVPETKSRDAQEGKPKAKEPKDMIVINDLQGGSFRAIERQLAVLRVLDDSDGVRKDDLEFLNDVREEIGYTIDRKTFRRDIALLVNRGKLEEKKISIDGDDTVIEDNVEKIGDPDYDENQTEVKLEGIKAEIPIFVANTATATAEFSLINSLRKSVPEKQTLKKLAEVSLDIDFFDTELRDSFHRVPAPVAPRVKPEKISKKKAITSSEAPKKYTYTTRVKATEKIKPDDSKDDFFKSLKRKRKRASKSEATEETTEVTEPKPKPTTRRGRAVGRKRKGSQLTSEESLLLFKSVIIFKTINENQIDWQKISMFLSIDVDILRVKWPRIRMMMGPVGVKIARRTWKRILLAAVKEGKITLEDVENLELEELISLWQDSELLGALNDDGEKLFVNVEDNYKQFNFVKVGDSSSGLQYDSNSMIQREHYLISKVFTYSDEPQEVEDKTNVSEEEEAIRKIIIAIVASGTNKSIRKLPVLEKFPAEMVNKVFLRMTRNRELLVSGLDSKILLGDRLISILDDHSYQLSLNKVAQFQTLVKDLLDNNKGIVLDQLFDNEFMVSILELVKENALNITRVDHYRREVLTGYEARTLEREKLDSDIILTKGDTSLIKTSPEKQVLLPAGDACTRVWIDVTGNFNKEIWTKIIRTITTTLLSNPGITEKSLFQNVLLLLSKDELELVLKWLVDSKAIRRGEFDGYWLLPQWYMALA